MKTKLLNILAVLALTASSLAIHQSAVADGAYRMGSNDDGGSRYYLIGAVVGAADSMAATVAAQAECIEQQDAQPGSATNLASLFCNRMPFANHRDPQFPTETFKDQCIVAVRILSSSHFDIGVGIADNCEQARTNARANCVNDCSTFSETTLNTDNALYLTDGEATACPMGQYAESADNTVVLNCLPAMMDEHCEQNDDDFPINNADGECRARTLDDCETGEILIDGKCGVEITVDDCGTDEIFTDGKCDVCPNNSVPNSSQLECVCDTANNFVGDSADSCTCNEAENYFADGDSCLLVECGDNSTRNGTTCTCNAGFVGEDGKNCTCETEGEIANSEGICESSALSIVIGEDTVQTTADNRHNIRFINVTAAAFTIVGNSNFQYAKIGDSSEALTVSEDGIVSFVSEIESGGDYEIFIAASQGETIISTLSLYLAVGQPPLPQPQPTAQPVIKSKKRTGTIAGLAVLGIIALHASFQLSAKAIHWTPTYAIHHHNGNMQYSLGSRWTAAADNWRYYWQTRQDNGDFVYGSGMRYNGKIFAAAMHAESESDKTDIGVALSANKTAGMWNLGGGYDLDMNFTDTETNTKNRLNIAAAYTLDRWLLSATATTENRLNIAADYKVDRWILSANARINGDTAKAAVDYSYRF